MPEAEIMGEEFKKTRNFYLKKIRDGGNENLADILETTSAQKIAREDFIDGLKTSFPEFREELESLSEEVRDLQSQGQEAHDWTKYFKSPHNQSQKGFKPKALADDIEKEYSFRKLRDSEQIYVFKEGFFQPKGEQVVEEECEKRLGPEYRPKHLNKVQAFIEARNYIDRKEFRPPKKKINLKNGVYDLESEQLLEHNPAYNFRHKVPVKWNPDADCDAIHEFLESIVKGEEQVKTLREIAGYLMLPSYPISKAFMLIGKGKNGKSIYLELLKNLVGEHNYVNKSLQQLEENNFATSKLVGSMACFDDDLPSTKLKRTSTLKKLTGGSDVAAEVKYGDQFDFKNISKFVFACNELPRTADDSDGFFRRWMLVEFPYKFKENPDPENEKEKEAIPRGELVEDITDQEELEGFVWWAIESLKDVLKNHEFTHAPSTQEAREKWKEFSTPMVQFINKYIEQGTTWNEAESIAEDSDVNSIANYHYDYIRKDFLAQVIGDYCEARSHSRPSKKAITKELKNSDFYMNEKAKTQMEPESKQIPVYGGLKLNYPDPEGVEGLKTYSETFSHACARAYVAEDSQQSVQPFNGGSLEEEIEDYLGEEKKEVQDVVEDLEFPDEKIEAKIDEMENNGLLYRPEQGLVQQI